MPYTPKPKHQLPPHLRERWIVAEPELEPIKPLRLKKGTDGNYTVVQDGSVTPIVIHPPIPPYPTIHSPNPNPMATMSPMMTANPMAMLPPMFNQTLPWSSSLPTMQSPTVSQNVANINPILLPYNMMPQQQAPSFFYPS